MTPGLRSPVNAGLPVLSAHGPLDGLEVTAAAGQRIVHLARCHGPVDLVQALHEPFLVRELGGGDAQTNADIIRAILSGKETGPKRDAVLLNAGAALFVAGEADTISTGMELAGAVIDDGRAIKKLNSLAR